MQMAAASAVRIFSQVAPQVVVVKYGFCNNTWDLIRELVGKQLLLNGEKVTRRRSYFARI